MNNKKIALLILTPIVMFAGFLNGKRLVDLAKEKNINLDDVRDMFRLFATDISEGSFESLLCVFLLLNAAMFFAGIVLEEDEKKTSVQEQRGNQENITYMMPT